MWRLAWLVVLAGAVSAASSFSGTLGLDSAWFLQESPYEDVGQVNISGYIEPLWTYATESTVFDFRPFYRVDSLDHRRSHGDIRELSVTRTWGDLELKAGISKVFWGVAESNHLVDVINQMDLIENPDGEDRLGQPMIKLAYFTPLGAVEGFVLPGFRERTFSGDKGRYRFPVPVLDAAIYQDDAKDAHVDWAVRWFHTLGMFDIGVAHFSGTSREPNFIAGSHDGRSGLIPFYSFRRDDRIQLSLEVYF